MNKVDFERLEELQSKCAPTPWNEVNAVMNQLPAIVAELRAARAVVEAAKNYYYNISNSQSELNKALKAYDAVTEEEE